MAGIAPSGERLVAVLRRMYWVRATSADLDGPVARAGIAVPAVELIPRGAGERRPQREPTTMTIARALGLSLLLAGLLGSPAAADHGGIHPTFRTEANYFHCNGPTKAYNANWAAALGDTSAYIPWDTTPPTQSVADGGGCGGMDIGWTTNDAYDMVFYGTFTGNLRDMTVHLHELLVGNLRSADTQQVRVYAEVDGVPVFPAGDVATVYEGRAFTVAPETTNSGATALYEFTITNLGYAEEVLDEAGNVVDVETGGAATEHGDGEDAHLVRLLVGIDSFPGEDPPTGTTLWAWDTTEVPSGITFNPKTPADATVAADLPGEQTDDEPPPPPPGALRRVSW